MEDRAVECRIQPAFCLAAALAIAVLWICPCQTAAPQETDGQGSEGTAAGAQQPGQQSPENARNDYYLKDTEAGRDFVQKLSCPPQDGVLNYDFIVERYDESSAAWVQGVSVKNEDGKAEVSLKAGKYRYKVVLYNYLDTAEAESGWMEIEIKKAYEPKVSEVWPKIVYLEEENDGIFTVSGTDLLPDTVYSLDRKGGTVRMSLKAALTEKDSRGKRARIRIDINKLDTAVYTLRAVNPGGLSAESGEIVVKFRKPVDLDVSLGYSPCSALYDETMSGYFGKSFWPLGAGAKAEILPFKHNYGSFGFLLDARYVYLDGSGSGYAITGNMACGTVNFAFQKYLYKRRMLFCAYAGAGISWISNLVFDFGDGVYSDIYESYDICADAGLTLQCYVTKRFYIEIEGNYSHVFMTNMMFGRAEPRLSAGWRF